MVQTAPKLVTCRHLPGTTLPTDEGDDEVNHCSHYQDLDQQVVKLLEDKLPQWGARIGGKLVAAIHPPGLLGAVWPANQAACHLIVPPTLGCLSNPA